MAARNEIALDIRGRDMATRELQAAAAALGELGKKAENLGFIGSSMSKIWTGAMLHIGESIKNTLFKGISVVSDALIGFNARQEQALIGFTTMLGSATKAQGFMEELQDFAAATPFEFDGLRQSANLIMAMGFEAKEVIPLLTAAGDAVAALGLGTEAVQRVVYALGQMRAAGRVTGQDMMQLSSMGIPAWKMLADSMNMTVQETKKLAEQGAIDAETAIAAITSAIENGNMGGMMAAQARTFNGALSTIKDTAQIVIANAFKPMFDAISMVAIAIADFLGSEGFLDWADDVGRGFGSVIDKILQMGRSIIPIASSMLPVLGTALGNVVDVFLRVFDVGMTVFGGMLSVLGAILPHVSGLIGPLVMLGVNLKIAAAAAALMAGSSGIGGLIMGLPIVGGLITTTALKILAMTASTTGFTAALKTMTLAFLASPMGILAAAAAMVTLFLTFVDVGKEIDDLAMDFGTMGESVDGLMASTGRNRDAIKDQNTALRELGFTFDDAIVVQDRYGERAEVMGERVIGLMDDLDISVNDANALVDTLGSGWRGASADIIEATEQTGVSWYEAYDHLYTMNAGMIDSEEITRRLTEAAEEGPEAWRALTAEVEVVATEVERLADVFEAGRPMIEAAAGEWLDAVEQIPEGFRVTLSNGESIVTEGAEAMVGQIKAAVERAEADVIEVMARTPGAMSQAIIDNSDAFNSGLDLLVSMVDGTVDSIITVEEEGNAIRFANQVLADVNSTAQQRLQAFEVLNLAKAASLERIALATASGADETMGYAHAIDMNNWLVNESGMDINAINADTWAEALRLAQEAGADDPAEYAAAMRGAKYLVGDAARATADEATGPLGINFWQSGYNAGASWANGIEAATAVVRTASGGLAEAARGQIGIMSEPTDPSSPLRGITQWGGNAGRTWGAGLLRSAGVVERDAAAVARAAREGLSGLGTGSMGIGGTVSGMMSSGGGGGGQSVTIINNFGAGSVRSDDDIRAISAAIAGNARLQGVNLAVPRLSLEG